MSGQVDGTTVREARPEDASGIARVSVDTWRAVYRGIMPDKVLEELSYERREAHMGEIIESLPGDQVFLVAVTDDNEIVAFVSGGPERTGEHPYDGEIYAVYVLPSYQGRGLGKRLMREAAKRLVEGGHRSLMLWVATANQPSRAFYERLGGWLIGERDLEMGALVVAEVAYGWPEARELVEA